MKICTKCEQEKELSKFYKDKAQKSGLRPSCIACEKKYRSENKHIKKQWQLKNRHKDRNSHYKRNYGITLDDYNELLKSQHNKCAICKSTETKNKLTKYLVVDHCHESSKVRGLLCDKCNTALGAFDDNIDTLKEAIKYLENNNEQ